MNTIVEQQLRRELAMTNVVVESKIKFDNNLIVWVDQQKLLKKHIVF